MLRAICLSGLILLSIDSYAANLYRYINEKGYQEIGHDIPPHLVANGYDVIDQTGRLVRRVAPQLSEEDYAAKLEIDRRLDQCLRALERVNRRYETLTDIDDAQALFGRQNAESIRNDEANLTLARSQLEEAHTTAARAEREGRALGRDTLLSIERAENQIDSLIVLIEKRERLILDKKVEFDEERQIFQQGGCDELQAMSNEIENGR